MVCFVHHSILTMPRPAKTTSCSFYLIYVPHPLPRLRQRQLLPLYPRFPVTFPALPLVWVTPPPLFLVAQGMASLGRPLAPPLPWSIRILKSIYFAASSRIWTANSWFPPRFLLSRLFSLTRVLFTRQPLLIDHFRPSVYLQVPPHFRLR